MCLLWRRFREKTNPRSPKGHKGSGQLLSFDHWTAPWLLTGKVTFRLSSSFIQVRLTFYTTCVKWIFSVPAYIRPSQREAVCQSGDPRPSFLLGSFGEGLSHRQWTTTREIINIWFFVIVPPTVRVDGLIICKYLLKQGSTWKDWTWNPAHSRTTILTLILGRAQYQS